MKDELFFTKPNLTDFKPQPDCKTCLGSGVIWYWSMPDKQLDKTKFKYAVPCCCLGQVVEGVKPSTP